MKLLVTLFVLFFATLTFAVPAPWSPKCNVKMKLINMTFVEETKQTTLGHTMTIPAHYAAKMLITSSDASEECSKLYKVDETRSIKFFGEMNFSGDLHFSGDEFYSGTFLTDLIFE